MRIKEFYARITEGLALSELWAQFRAEARASYCLYSGDIDWTTLESQPQWKKILKIAWALFWQMLMYLSPARRVLLLVSVLFVVLGVVRIPAASGSGVANAPAFGCRIPGLFASSMPATTIRCSAAWIGRLKTWRSEDFRWASTQVRPMKSAGSNSGPGTFWSSIRMV